MTNLQIKAELDSKGVKYPSKAKKAKLLELLATTKKKEAAELPEKNTFKGEY